MITAGSYDPRVGENKIKRHIVGLTGNFIHNLKIVTETDKSARSLQVVERPVIVSFAVTNSSSAEIKGHAGNNYYVCLVRGNNLTRNTRLKNAEATGTEH